jgi:hypothetical protein
MTTKEALQAATLGAGALARLLEERSRLDDRMCAEINKILNEETNYGPDEMARVLGGIEAQLIIAGRRDPRPGPLCNRGGTRNGQRYGKS